MPTLVKRGELVKDIDLMELIPPDEGELNQYYGRIGSGKTYVATMDVLDDLKRGQVVIVNWRIKYDGYDQRKVLGYKFLGALGIKRKFWFYPAENLHYLDIRNMKSVVIDGKDTGMDFYEWFSRLTSCRLYLDEGHIYYDSYLATKMNLGIRVAILDTRHYDRSVNVISQRPTAIHAVLRGNVNRFYKIERLSNFLGMPRFEKTEFQDTTSSDVPNEERERIVTKSGEVYYGDYLFAVRQDRYWGRQKYFDLYDSKFRREGTPESQSNNAQLYKVRYRDNLKELLWHN